MGLKSPPMTDYKKWAAFRGDDSDDERGAVPSGATISSTHSSSSSSSGLASSKALDTKARVAALKAKAAARAVGSSSPASAATQSQSSSSSSGADAFVSAAVASGQGGAAAAYAQRLADEAAALASEAKEKSFVEAKCLDIERRAGAALAADLLTPSAFPSTSSPPVAPWSALEAEAAELSARLPQPSTEAVHALVSTQRPGKAHSHAESGCSHDGCGHSHDHRNHNHSHSHSLSHGGAASDGHQGCGHSCDHACETETRGRHRPAWREELSVSVAGLRVRLSLARAASLAASPSHAHLAIDACRAVILAHPRCLLAWLLRGRAYASLGCSGGLLLAQLHIDKALALLGVNADVAADKMLHEGGASEAGKSGGNRTTAPESDPMWLDRAPIRRADNADDEANGEARTGAGTGAELEVEVDDEALAAFHRICAEIASHAAVRADLLAFSGAGTSSTGAAPSPSSPSSIFPYFLVSSSSLSSSPSPSDRLLSQLFKTKRAILAGLFQASLCRDSSFLASETSPSSSSSSSSSYSLSPLCAVSVSHASLLLGELFHASAADRFAGVIARMLEVACGDGGSEAVSHAWIAEHALAAVQAASRGSGEGNTSSAPLPVSLAPPSVCLLFVAAVGLVRSLVPLRKPFEGGAGAVIAACTLALELADSVERALASACSAVADPSGSSPSQPLLREARVHLLHARARAETETAAFDAAARDLGEALRLLGQGDGRARPGATPTATASSSPPHSTFGKQLLDALSRDSGASLDPDSLASTAKITLEGIWPGCTRDVPSASLSSSVAGPSPAPAPSPTEAAWRLGPQDINLALRRLAAARRVHMDADAWLHRGK